MKFTIKLLVLFFGVLMIGNVAYAETPREQLKLMVEQLQKTPSDNALREKIIKLAQEIKPAPAVPEEARRYLARGIAAFKTAKSAEDFKIAVVEFQNAANAAPWWPDTYFNLAKVQEKTGDFKGAIASYRYYLAADPNAKDAESIRTQSYKLEFMAEQKAKEDRARAEQKVKEDEAIAKEAQRKQQAKTVLNQLKQKVEGVTYSRRICSINENVRECSWAEYAGNNWIFWGGGARTAIERFDFSEDGTVRLVFIDSFPETDSINLVGTPDGPSISDIKWVCPKFEYDGGKARISGSWPTWVNLAHDGSAITYTCATTNPTANPSVRYPYWYFQKN